MGWWLCLGSAGVLAAEATPELAEHWRALTRGDVEAAYTLLAENHPGALAQVGDTQFVTALASAHARAVQRAAAVAGYEGYIATLGEFAAALGDGHIGSGPHFLPRTLQWPGLLVAKRGSAWTVVEQDPAAALRLAGARLVSCDARAADAFASEALHFRAVASVQAAQAMNGAWLLLDDGNPFLTRPQACVFELGGTQLPLTLQWHSISRDAVFRDHWRLPYGAAGYGLRALPGGGYWIAIQQLTPPAQAVLDAAQAQQAALRSASFVVVDLRGNGGGDDAYGRELAQILYGADYVAQRLGAHEGVDDCQAFRASPANIEATRRLAAAFRSSGDTAGAAMYSAALAKMVAAAAAGRELSGSLTCPKPASRAHKALALMRGKVLVLSDVACFSSCIQTVGYFRTLGAEQIGQITGADTHYSEVRQIELPSGLSAFSTLMAIMTDAPRELGPYLPAVEYQGDIADTAAVTQWVLQQVHAASSP
jgi:hypothetical protein